MCGRYTLTTRIGQDVADRFDVRDSARLVPETLGRFNVCPTEPVAVVTAEREARALRWGLVPPWARAVGKGFEPINLRAETVATKQPFAKLLPDPGHRCLVLADGWYEWLKAEHKGAARIPFRYTVDGGAPFAFAGVFDGAGAAILTGPANEVCAPVHDRMPCVLEGPEAEAAWLSADVDVPAACELLAPLAAARVTAAPANPAVNKAGVEGL